jgi:Ubiquitin carboxyl-terminal hydrolase
MNSVLQSLFHSIPYRQKVLNSTFAADSVGEKLFWLFEEMEGSSCVDTAQVAYSLNLNVGSQEDAQEFLLRLLNEIDSSAESDSDNELNNSEPVSTTFTGITEQIIKCTNVNFTKSRQQRFLDLTVDILGYDSLSSALKNMFSKPDYLTGNERIICFL